MHVSFKSPPAVSFCRYPSLLQEGNWTGYSRVGQQGTGTHHAATERKLSGRSPARPAGGAIAPPGCSGSGKVRFSRKQALQPVEGTSGHQAHPINTHTRVHPSLPKPVHSDGLGVKHCERLLGLRLGAFRRRRCLLSPTMLPGGLYPVPTPCPCRPSLARPSSGHSQDRMCD